MLPEGQPEDPIEAAHQLGRTFYATLFHNPNIIVAPFVVQRNNCVFLSALQRDPDLGWVMDRQNCTQRWLEPRRPLPEAPGA